MTEQRYRLAGSGRIDRARPLGFTFNGVRYDGFAGDTLASALLAAGLRVVGRSFKYHRPRGIYSAGPEEPNALVQLGSGGGRSDPNRRATQVELVDGLVAESQNCWPNVRFDVGVANDLLSPLIPAGFYYKTFMGPGGDAWMWYERFIRRAAGLGKAPMHRDPDRYERTYAHCDVLVVGGGPAGLMAAFAAGRTGARVILADEQSEFGGNLLVEPDAADAAAAIDGAPPMRWAAEMLDKLAAMPEVRLLPRTTAFGYYDHNYLGLLERVTDHLAPGSAPERPRHRLWKLRAAQVVLATGAIERPLVFADNDRPGIMLAGAARAYVNRYAVAPGETAVVFTNNDSAYATALDLKRAGLSVAAVIDARETADGGLQRAARAAGIAVRSGHVIVGTQGRGRVSSVAVQRLGADGTTVDGLAERIPCDLLCVSGGWNPTVHLFSQSRGRVRYDDARGIFLPGQSVQAERSAGACNGAFGLADCLREGAAAGLQAAEAAGFSGRKPAAPKVEQPDEAPPRPLWQVPSRRRRAKRFVDLENDVTVSDLKLAIREGYRSVEHVKRYTTQGMGTDQGKTGSVNALGVIAETRGQPLPEVGTTTFRAPYTPVSFGAFAGRDIGALHDPVRRTPLFGWHTRNGAVFEDVGQWKRPWYYPRDGETMHEAVQREVKAARTSVGIVDASTLGKIEIRGRDAVELLNRVYTNAWSKLEVGRCRYGLMLGDDGFVMDDGVTARLGPDHFLMSTTTGNAAPVLAWLEEWLQTEWPNLKVYLTTVTEQWTTIGLCGPNARNLVQDLTDDIDLTPEALPHMAICSGHVCGVPARLARISFTGELGYEINVPASYGLAVWQACMRAGEPYDITPYGTEAMHVLRAEKGFIIVGQETDGTVHPHDLGMSWICSRSKPDFIGKRGMQRADLTKDGRKQLVGLLTEDPREVLEEGAHLIESLDAAPPLTILGHVTSSYYSPNVGRSIALGLIRDGHARKGERLYVRLAQRAIPVSVADPVFFDPKGERLNA